MAPPYDEVAVLVGPPYSEIVEALQAGRDDAAWAAVDSCSYPSVREDDPAQPERAAAALGVDDERTPS